jgi:hypothetical protein
MKGWFWVCVSLVRLFDDTIFPLGRLFGILGARGGHIFFPINSEPYSYFRTHVLCPCLDVVFDLWAVHRWMLRGDMTHTYSYRPCFVPL